MEEETIGSFGWAIARMKDGARVFRSGWNGKDMFLFLVDGSTFAVNRAPLNKFYKEGTEVKYQPHIDMKTVDGTVVPWLASQTDVLAEDWEEWCMEVYPATAIDTKDSMKVEEEATPEVAEEVAPEATTAETPAAEVAAEESTTPQA